jgi:uncharacterized protein
MNPFTFGNPIKESSRFYGRETDLRQVVNRLLSSAHESTSIIGERRMGKTSLLYHLSDPVVAEKHGLTPDKFCLVYVDFQGLTDITPTRFWQRVLKMMLRSICDKELVPAIEKLIEQESFDLFDLEDLFESIVDRGLTIVLMMDEFEYVTQNPNFKGDFFGSLRALAIHHGVALIPATRRELVDLCHSEELKGSPFFNIFANVVLHPFDHPTVINMLDGYTRAGEFNWSEEDKNFVWKLAGGYPFFVQMAGHYVMEGKIQGLEDKELFHFATSQFEQQSESHFTYLWSHCSESEKITLFILLSQSLQKSSKKTISNLENITRLHSRSSQDLINLRKRGLVLEQDGLYSLFSPAFGSWIRQEIIAGPGEDEPEISIDDWIKNSGHENAKAAKEVLPKFKKKYWPIMGTMLKEFTVKLAVDVALEAVKGVI